MFQHREPKGLEVVKVVEVNVMEQEVVGKEVEVVGYWLLYPFILYLLVCIQPNHDLLDTNSNKITVIALRWSRY